MNKKILLCLLVLLITFTFVGCKKEEEVPPESPPTVKTRLLIELDEYKDLKVEDIAKNILEKEKMYRNKSQEEER